MSIVPYDEPDDLPALSPAELIDEYRLATEALGRFDMTNADVLIERRILAEEQEEAKQAILALMAKREIDMLQDVSHGLTITLSQPDRGQYDLEKLPESVRARPGVVKQVADKDVIKKLLKRKRGGLTAEEREQVESAWVENKIKPSLRITNKDGKNG